MRRTQNHRRTVKVQPCQPPGLTGFKFKSLGNLIVSIPFIFQRNLYKHSYLQNWLLPTRNFLITLLFILLVPALAHACDYSWNGSSSNTWATGTNWTPTGPPSAGSNLCFPATYTNQPGNNNIAANTSYNSITITGTGYTLAGNAIDLAATGIISNVSGGSNTISLAIVLTANSAVTVTNSNETLALNGIISGGFSETTSGSGTLKLGASNTFSGGLTIDSGTVSAGPGNSLGGSGTGTVTLGNSAGSSNVTLDTGTNNATYANPIVLASNTTGTLTIEDGGPNGDSFTGGVTGTNSLLIDNATNQTVTFSTGVINNTGTITNDGSNSGIVTISANIGSNVTGVTEDPTSTSPLDLSGTNSYAGATTIDTGTIKALGANELGGASSTSALVMNGGTLDMDGNSQTVGSITGTGSTITSTHNGTMTLTTGNDNTSKTYSGTITIGSATDMILTKVGTGTLTLTGANTYNDGTNFNGGILDFMGTGLGSAGTLTFGGGTLQYGTSTTTDLSSRFAAPSSSPITIDTVNNNVTFATAITSTNSLVLNSSGTGTLTLNATNTFTGGLTIDSGTVDTTNNPDAFGGDGTGTVTLGNSSGGSSSATIEGAYNNQTYANPIVLASTTTGTLTIEEGSVNGAFSGGVTGTNNLTLDNTGSSGFTLSTNSINNTGTVTNSSTGSGGTTISSNIGSNVTGVFQNSSTSQLTLSGANTFAGGLTIDSGTVVGNATESLGGSGTGTVYLGSSSGNNSATLEGGVNFATLANPIVLASSTTGALTIANAGGNAPTFSGGVTGTNSFIIDDVNSTHQITFSTLSINNTGTVSNAGTGAASVTISSVIGSNVTGVYQNSSTSALVLSGANTYTGYTDVASGTLQTTAANVLGGASSTSALQMNGGTLDMDGHSEAVGSITGTGSTITSTAAGTMTLTVGYDNTSPAVYSGTITIGSATNMILTKVGTGTLSLSGTNTYNDGTNINGGILNFTTNALGSAGTITFGGGALQYGTSTTTDLSSRFAAPSTSPITIDTVNNNVTFGIAITSTNAVVLNSSGTGALTLNATNTFTGGLTIDSGTVTGDTASSLGASGTGTVVMGNSAGGSSNATLNDVAGTFANPIVLAPNTTGTLTIENLGVGSATFTGGVTGTNNLTFNEAEATNRTLLFSTNPVNNLGTITNISAGTGNVQISSNIGSSVSGVYQNSSTNFLQLEGTNTFTGGLTILSGTVYGDTATQAFGGNGTGTIYLGNSAGGSAAAAVQGNSGTSFANPIVLEPNTTGTLSIINTGGGSPTFTGGVTGTNNLTLDALGHTLTISTGSINNVGTVTNGSTGVANLSVSSVIGTNVTGVIQNSSTTAMGLSGANTFTSGLTILSGTVQGSTSTFAFGGSGTGTIILGNSAGGSSSATVAALSSTSFANPIVLASTTTGTLTIEDGAFSSSYVASFTGGVTGTNNLTIDDPGVATLTLSTGAINNIGTVTNASTNTGVVTISANIGSNVTGLTEAPTSTSPLDLSGTNSYTGATTISTGTIKALGANELGGASSTAQLQMNGGTLDMDGNSQAVGSITGTGSAITSTAAGTFTLTTGNDNTNTSYSGTITVGSSTSFALNKVGTGTLTLTGADTYNGGTTFTGGILDFTGTALGSSGNLTFSGGTLQWGTSTTTDLSSRFNNSSTSPITLDNVSNNVTLATAITTSNGVVVNSSGTGTFLLNATNTFSGGLTVDSGTVETTNNLDGFGGSGTGTVTLGNSAGGSSNATMDLAWGNQTFANPVVLAPNTTGTLAIENGVAFAVTFTGGVTGTNNLTIKMPANGTFNFGTGNINNTGTVTNASTGTGNVDITSTIGSNVNGVIENSSTTPLILSGPNTFTGGLTINSGTVKGLTSADALGGSGSGTVTLGNSAGGGSSATLIGGSNTTFANPIVLAPNTTGTLSLETVAFVTANFSGGVTGTNNLTLNGVTNGEININTQPVNNSGEVINAGSGSNDNATISSVIGTNVTGVIENGASPLILSGANTFTGGLTIDAGTVEGQTSNNAFGGSGSGTIILGNSTGGSNSATLVSNPAGGTTLTFANPIVLASNTTGALTIVGDGSSASSVEIFSGGLTGTNNLTITTYNNNGASVQFTTATINNSGTITDSSNFFCPLTISSAIGPNVTGITYSSGKNLTISGAITVNSSSTTLTNSSTSGGSDLGTFSITGGTTGSGNLIINNTGSFGSTTLSGTSINHTGTVTNSGTGSLGATISAGIGTNVTGVTENGTAPLTLSAANTYTSNSTITSGTLNLGINNAIISPTVSIASGGTLNLAGFNITSAGSTSLSNSGILELQGGETVTNAPTNNTGSTVEYTKTSGTTALKSWTYTNATIEINGSGGTFTLPADETVAGVALAAGTLNSNSHNITDSGNWTNTGGSFTQGTKTVTFNGTSAQTVTSDGQSFYNIVDTNTAASPGLTFADAFSTTNFTDTTSNSILEFNPATTDTISGTLNLAGTSGNLIQLSTSGAGTNFVFNVTGGQQNVSYLNVNDADASSNNIVCPTCTGLGAGTTDNDGHGNALWELSASSGNNSIGSFGMDF